MTISFFNFLPRNIFSLNMTVQCCNLFFSSCFYYTQGRVMLQSVIIFFLVAVAFRRGDFELRWFALFAKQRCLMQMLIQSRITPSTFLLHLVNQMLHYQRRTVFFVLAFFSLPTFTKFEWDLSHWQRLAILISRCAFLVKTRFRAMFIINWLATIMSYCQVLVLNFIGFITRFSTSRVIWQARIKYSLKLSLVSRLLHQIVQVWVLIMLFFII